MGVLLGASVLLSGGASLAQKPTPIAAASDWQKGKKFNTTRKESFRLCAGTTVTLAAQSVAEVQGKIPLPTSIEGLGPFAYTAQLTSGRIDVAIDTKQKPANGVIVYGPRKTTVLARGGRVSIVAGPSSLAVAVYDGKEASIGIGPTWKQVTAGNVMTVSAESPQGLESKLPTVPQRVVVARPILAIGGTSEPVLVEWDPVRDAKRYALSLTNTATKERRELEAPKAGFALGGLEPGRYELSISAVEAMGLRGPASPPAYVNVVGVELPPGAFAAKGKVYLEALQQLNLTHVEGLEASYDRASIYFKAASQASLRGTQATTLHLRIPGSLGRASLELLPRDLHTQVEISPALARWPRDKVIVRIQLPPLLTEARTVKLVPSVTVNNQLVPLEWVTTGQQMETVIPAPPSYPGPWVLRAEVADQHGIVLGRNFLEIASTAGLDDEDIPREIHRAPIQVRTSQVQAKR